MYYRICPFCGAVLDPCERCDCGGQRNRQARWSEPAERERMCFLYFV